MFPIYPYLNIQDLNLDYILRVIRSMQQELTDFVVANAIKYADPIQWNITSQYEKNTIVIDPISGTAYISVQPVPMGIILTNTDYWTVVFDLEQFVIKANNNFTLNIETSTTLTATFPTSKDSWLIWGDELYIALVNIIAGDQYVVGSNIERITMENYIGLLANLTTDNKDSIVDALNSIVDNIGGLTNLSTTDKTSIVNAINEIVDVTIGSLTSLLTSDKSSIVNAINEVVSTHRQTNMPVYNVKEHGADNTGNVSCTSLVNAAITAGEKEIYFEAGVYLLDNTITITDNVHFYGDGHNTILILDGGGIVVSGYYTSIHDVTLKANVNGINGITINTSYNEIKNLFVDEQVHYFQNVILVGDSNLSWFNSFINIRINDVNINTTNGYGIYFKQGFNCLIDECYIQGKYCAIYTDTVGGQHCEGIQITGTNIIGCWLGFNFNGGNAIFITNVICDQMLYESLIADAVDNLFLDSCYFAPALSAGVNYGTMNLNGCSNVRIAKFLSNTHNNNNAIGIFNCHGLTIIDSRFESAVNAIVLGDNLSDYCWFDQIYCDNVTNALYLQGYHNKYGVITGGSIVLAGVPEQATNVFCKKHDIGLSGIATPYEDITVSIDSIDGVTIPWFVSAQFVNCDALYSIVYNRNSSTPTSLSFRIRTNDGTNIGSLYASLSIMYAIP